MSDDRMARTGAEPATGAATDPAAAGRGRAAAPRAAARGLASLVLALPLLAALAGCAGGADPAATVRALSPFAPLAPSLQARIAAMRPGETRVDDAVAALGAPAARGRADDGARTLSWQHFEGGLTPASLLPIAGAYSGAGESVQVRSQLVFGPDERLREVRQERRRIDGRIRDAAGTATPTVPWATPR